MTAAESLIRREIRRDGAIPFARFMELALYSPNSGYYEAHDRTIGRSGDFFTSISVGEVFGQLMSWDFLDEASRLPEGIPLRIVEAGAHDGRLAGDILSALQAASPGILTRLQYIVIEPSPRRREWQQSRLLPWEGRVEWHPSWETVGPVDGLILCNELLDAFPIHRLRWSAASREWREQGVAERAPAPGIPDGPLEWTDLPIASLDIGVALADSGLEIPPALAEVLPEGYVLEVCPGAMSWWRAAASHLRSGRILGVDYGRTAAEWIIPERPAGTARAYRSHRTVPDLLASPGEQDLTADVNFSAIAAVGEDFGLRTEGLWRQGDYLTRVLARRLKAGFDPAWTAAQRAQFQTLVHPSHLGYSFRVLAQAAASASPLS